MITEFSLPTVYSQPQGIAAGPDGNVWFTVTDNKIGQITPAGVIRGSALRLSGCWGRSSLALMATSGSLNGVVTLTSPSREAGVNRSSQCIQRRHERHCQLCAGDAARLGRPIDTPGAMLRVRPRQAPVTGYRGCTSPTMDVCSPEGRGPPIDPFIEAQEPS